MLTPNDLLEHANRAYQANVAREEWARAGVSRLYYACYHFCKQAATMWCSSLPDHLAETGEHQKLIRRLKTQGKDSTIKSHLTNLANILGKALDERVNADYYLDRAVGQDQYAKSLRYGREIKLKVDEIQQILNQRDVESNESPTACARVREEK